jgi:hypothetical protein
MTQEVADETDFDILTHRLDFLGICSDFKNTSLLYIFLPFY